MSIGAFSARFELLQNASFLYIFPYEKLSVLCQMCCELFVISTINFPS